MASNTEIEMRWVAVWNELYELVGDRREVVCQLPDWTIVDVEQCKAWLQQSVYEGYFVEVKTGWVGHQQGIVVSRSPVKS